jgi:hypothetical protein
VAESFNMTKQLLSLTILGVLAVSATAQQTKPIGLSARIGAYFPTYSLSGVSKDTGIAYGLSYAVYKASNYTVEAEYFGNTHKAKSAGVSRNLNNWAFSAVGYYNVPMQPYYVGLGLGFGKTNLNLPGVNVNTNTQFVYTLIGGYNFTSTVFGEVRYQGSSENTLRGFTVLAGYRF